MRWQSKGLISLVSVALLASCFPDPPERAADVTEDTVADTARPDTEVVETADDTSPDTTPEPDADASIGPFCARAGDPCDDGNPCTEQDACSGAGRCEGRPRLCDDREVCTEDFCDGATGACRHSSRFGAACDDGDSCTEGDACTAGGACAGAAKACDDGDPCTHDSCVKASGACRHEVALGASCDDGDACTTEDACSDDGRCRGEPTLCDDQNLCTDDSCGPDGACVFMPRTGRACDDGFTCTTSDECDSRGVCVGTAILCEDASPCAVEACTEEYDGCTSLANYRKTIRSVNSVALQGHALAATPSSPFMGTHYVAVDLKFATNPHTFAAVWLFAYFGPAPTPNYQVVLSSADASYSAIAVEPGFGLGPRLVGVTGTIDEAGERRFFVAADYLSTSSLGTHIVSPAVTSLTGIDFLAGGRFLAVGAREPTVEAPGGVALVEVYGDGTTPRISGIGESAEVGVAAATVQNVGAIVLSTSTTSHGAVLTLLDESLAIVWRRTFPRSEWERPTALAVADDGFVVVGEKGVVPYAATHDLRLTKLDRQGLTVWTTVLDENEPLVGAAVTTSRTAIAVAGQRGSNAWLVVTDAQGNPLWQDQYDSGEGRTAYAGVVASAGGTWVTVGSATNPLSPTTSFMVFARYADNGPGPICTP